MARRPRKTYRWPIALAEVLLLLASLISAGHAAGAAADPATASAPGIDAANDPLEGKTFADGNDLYLDVTVNGASKGLAHFGTLNGELYATVAALRRLGFDLPLETPDPVRLASLAGVQVKYDAAQQTVSIDAPLKLLDLQRTLVNEPQNSVPKVTTSPGALLNYDVYSTLGEHQTAALNAFTEIRAFNSLGVLSATSLAQTNYDKGAGWVNRFERLDTSWTMSFPEQMLALRIGDVQTDALSWSRGTRLGGVQFGTDFALQPYRVTTPLPAFFGSATLPSDVELYINGVKQYSGNVPAGPFQLTTVPNINGAGNAQIVVTDALGRVSTLNFSLYNAPQLLAQGLSDWSVEVGAVRQNYGLRSFDYGHDAVASGTWRYGVTNGLTVETHAEATAGLVDGGAGGSWVLGKAGVVSAAFAHSAYHGQSGSLASLGYDWRGDVFSFDLGGTRTQGNYLDVGSLYGSPPPKISAHAQVGFNTLALGSFNVGYLHLRETGQPASRFATLGWFKSIGGTASLGLNVNQSLDTSKDRSIFLNLTFALGRDTSASAGAIRSDGRYSGITNVNHSTPSDGGFGWKADAAVGGQQSGGDAELDYLGRYGRAALGVNALGDSRFAYADLSGSVVFMGGHFFAAQHIDNSFAVVTTDGIPAVPVMLENRPIGTTDKDGMLLVTPLNAYQKNQLGIDPMQLPTDVRIDRVKVLATPADRSGTLVRFGITPVRAAVIILVDGDGKFVALGSEVQINGKDGEPSLVGYDGVVYLDTLDEHNVLDVTTKGGTCRATFEYRKSSEGVQEIGPLVCKGVPR